ncbi:competence/damage-inducible protein A [bacterium]|nr:MAG: competence/damage-inducible protein A [bacterium]
MKAEILTIGNEILIGDIVNTNASWLGDQLTQLGFTVKKMVTVGDSLPEMLLALEASKQNDLVIITGGLGPTHDDITKKALQEFFKVGLKRDEQVLRFVKSFFESRGIPFSESNVLQADVLENAQVLFNNWGTAPGMLVDEFGTLWAIFPGVPKEMKHLFSERLRPVLQAKFSVPKVIKSSYLSVAGIGESTLSDGYLKSVEALLSDNVTLAYLPHYDGITLRITASGDNEKEVLAQVELVRNRIKELAGEFIFSEEKATLGEVVGQLLKQNQWNIGLAESCTGGGVAFELTHTPGSSAYVKGAIVAYANEIKEHVLGVKKETLDQFGAVSSETALEMAIGAKNVLNTEVGISITGIAGPGGGTEEKPVGLIWFGISTPNESFTFKVMLTKDREANRKRSIMIVLDALRRSLSGLQGLPYGAQRIVYS